MKEKIEQQTKDQTAQFKRYMALVKAVSEQKKKAKEN